ncbi:hypothetical protein QTG54_015612 [Skeletonema marinoi]|uniref:Uncharacterized protein n=1 Tax=Skeletonema marinoi TaxID=267567 RepID=A0AAD8XU39_9STRA|nr:hypothetical protein QTG54_015612 [Skeletonema marinoi]
MDGLSHYLQSSTQGAMIVPTQPMNKLKKLPQQQEDCVPPQYFSNSMSVLPADRYGSYYIIYHRDVSGECRDDNFDDMASHSFSTTGTRRDYGVTRDSVFDFTPKKSVTFLETNNSMVETEPKNNMMYDTNAGGSPRRSEQSSPTISMLDDEEYDNDSGFASHAAEACVACSIPVLHFIQFFMC